MKHSTHSSHSENSAHAAHAKAHPARSTRSTHAARSTHSHRMHIGGLWRHVGAVAAVALAATGAVLLTGCAAVGPNFHSPPPPAAAPASAAYTEVPIPDRTASSPGDVGAAQQFNAGADIPAAWWSLFHSAPLDALIRSALAQSPTLAAAQAALRTARENYNAEAGLLLVPNASGTLGVTGERVSNASFGVPGSETLTLYNASVNVSYRVDVFGAVRRQLEGLAAAVDVQRFQVEATYLALTANLVTTAIQDASLRAQIAATGDVLAAEERQLNIVQQQFGVGAVSRSAVLQQQTQTAQTRATLPPLDKALSLTRHQLAVYAGRLPSEADLPDFDLASLTLPTDLPVSLPSALVRQRPDIRASEALLHEASAQIGVATANLYPQINLTGAFGPSATKLGDLFKGGSYAWSLGAGLTAPLFNGGALRAEQRAAVASYDQAAAQYRATVLTAFQNVADSLRAIESDARALREQAAAEAVAKASLDLIKQQYQLGAVNSLALLDAERAWEQTRIALVQAQATRHADTAALFQSLGGGWWSRAALADASQPGTDATTPTPTLAPVQ